MNTEADIRQVLREWVSQKSGTIAPTALSDTTPIIEQRLISSLHILELILLLEQLTQRPIDVAQLKPGVFRDINTIYQHFFAEAVHGY
jgi:hypothetical protein